MISRVTKDEMLLLRRGAKLTQAQLGAKIGYSRQAIIDWERGHHPIAPDIAVTIAAATASNPAGVDDDRAQSRQDKQTLKSYSAMRADTLTHAEIIQFWISQSFTPSPEAQLAIAAAFPDILQPKET